MGVNMAADSPNLSVSKSANRNGGQICQQIHQICQPVNLPVEMGGGVNLPVSKSGEEMEGVKSAGRFDDSQKMCKQKWGG